MKRLEWKEGKPSRYLPKVPPSVVTKLLLLLLVLVKSPALTTVGVLIKWNLQCSLVSDGTAEGAGLLIGLFL